MPLKRLNVYGKPAQSRRARFLARFLGGGFASADYGITACARLKL